MAHAPNAGPVLKFNNQKKLASEYATVVHNNDNEGPVGGFQPALFQTA